MSPIDGERPVQQPEAAELTVHEAHRVVRKARLSHCRHGRGRPVHGLRRPHRPPVSQYRPADRSDPAADIATTRTDIARGRPSPPTVAALTVALSLLYVGIIRMIELDLNTKAVAFGVYFIAVTAALCLNAVALGAINPPADVRAE